MVPEEGREFISIRELADLARAGFSTVRQPSMQVNFEVHHVRDRRGYLQELLAEGPALREILSSAANGLGVVVATRVGTLDPEMRGRLQGSSAPVALKVEDNEEKDRVFRGTAWPNPSFIYEAAKTFEGIVSVDVEPMVPQYRNGPAIRALLHEISDLAANVGKAPILLLQCPAQLPPHRFVAPTDINSRDFDWPRASSLAARFAIALHDDSAALRLQLADRLALYCEERGFGLWLADRRAGYRTGNWFGIVKHDNNLARRLIRRAAGSGPSGAVACSLPITFVGPARVGSTNALLRFLSRYPQLGILGCSITSLDDLAFIHMQFAVNHAHASRLDAINKSIDLRIRAGASPVQRHLDASPPAEVLTRLLPVLLHEKEIAVSDDVKAQLFDRAGNYQTLVGPAMPIVTEKDEKRRPVWISWQTAAGTSGLAASLTALFRAFSSEAQGPAREPELPAVGPNVEYLICRDMGNSVVRAKGKVSVPEDMVPSTVTTALESAPERLCNSLRAAWRAELEGTDLEGVTDLGVSWREYRLSSPSARI